MTSFGGPDFITIVTDRALFLLGDTYAATFTHTEPHQHNTYIHTLCILYVHISTYLNSVFVFQLVFGSAELVITLTYNH